MADKFATAHAGAKKAEARVNDIFAIRQTTGEGLRDFLARFNRVRMVLPNVSEGMAVAAFQNGLNRDGSKATKKLLNRLMKYPPTTWEEIHNAYCAEVRADEDDLNGPTQQLTSVQSEVKRDRRNDERREPLPRFNRERHQPYVRAPIRLLQDIQTPCNDIPPSFGMKELGTKVQWPQKMKSDPSARRSNVLCEFHQERGHKTEDCIGLRQEVVRMLNQGYLKELLSDKGRANFAKGRDQSQGPPKPPSPARAIQMIVGGGDDSCAEERSWTTMERRMHRGPKEIEGIFIFAAAARQGRPQRVPTCVSGSVRSRCQRRLGPRKQRDIARGGTRGPPRLCSHRPLDPLH
ncbi:PREDICTED: uncharacterized protein LOC109211808 [Nicotiana attenuata]|uniref:uncharacterized protein LOC109211808 n=1 Tax=Nicotiana attenuata TaxID=49451 RepID=UPI0009046275|nr:PREDICTED: uncharacterized protein LOC109211808 [Nicotiana attenuata]